MTDFAGAIYSNYQETLDRNFRFQRKVPKELIDQYAENQSTTWRDLINQAVVVMQKAGRSDAINILRNVTGLIVEQARNNLTQEHTRTAIANTNLQDYVVSNVPLLDAGLNDIIKVERDAWQLIAVLLIWFPEAAKQVNVQIGAWPQLTIALAQMANPSLYKVMKAVAESDIATRKLDVAEDEYKKITALMEAALNRVREESIFKSASLLWQHKANSHTVGYLGGFFVIIVSLGLIALFVAFSGQNFLQAMPMNRTTGEFTYLAVLVVGLTFVALAWIYRMLGRFVLDNFTLASDARQRSMILQTFLTLVGTPEAQMKEGERVLILNAIFRPAPGQGSDDPAPSSLMDLMKGALPVAGTGEKKN